MAKGISIAAIEAGTGKSWDEWLTIFDAMGAASLSHKEIAAKVYESTDCPPWWGQMVTVAYEQHIGRRVPGQLCDGKFAVSVNKTMNGTMDDAIARWAVLAARPDSFSGLEISRGPEVSQSEKWRYWRCGLADGSRIAVNAYDKAPGKAALSVQHERLESADAAEHWRAHWKAVLAEV